METYESCVERAMHADTCAKATGGSRAPKMYRRRHRVGDWYRARGRTFGFTLPTPQPLSDSHRDASPRSTFCLFPRSITLYCCTIGEPRSLEVVVTRSLALPIPTQPHPTRVPTPRCKQCAVRCTFALRSNDARSGWGIVQSAQVRFYVRLTCVSKRRSTGKQ